MTNNPGIVKKSTARLVAVQALYAYEVDSSARRPADLALDLISYYQDDPDLTQPDATFLTKLLTKAIEEALHIDAIITDYLTENWSIDKISIVIKSILRCGICELKYMTEIPTKVIINEYTNIASAFYPDKEVGFVNGILDKIAKAIRT